MSVFNNVLDFLAKQEKSAAKPLIDLVNSGGSELFKGLSSSQLSELANVGKNVGIGGGVSIIENILKGGSSAVSGLSVKLPSLIDRVFADAGEIILKSGNIEKGFATKVAEQVAKNAGLGGDYVKLIGKNMGNRIGELAAIEGKAATSETIGKLLKRSTRRNISKVERDVSSDLAKLMEKDISKFDKAIKGNASFGKKSSRALDDLSKRIPDEILPELPVTAKRAAARATGGKNAARTVGGESTSVDAADLKRLRDFNEAKRLNGMKVTKFNKDGSALTTVANDVIENVPFREVAPSVSDIANSASKNIFQRNPIKTAVGATGVGLVAANRILGDNNTQAKSTASVENKVSLPTIDPDTKLRREMILELLKISRDIRN